MNYEIFKDGQLVNTIHGSEDFVKDYCDEHGYTYELRIDPEPQPQPVSEAMPTTEERLAQLETIVATQQEEAKPIMAAAKALAVTSTEIPDTIALDMAGLFSTWEDVLAAGQALAQGRIIDDGGQLYRVMQTVTPQAHQAPHDAGMLAIYRPIDKQHAGTIDDPVPWVYGMDCLEGLYYSYNGDIYRVATGGSMIPCTWAPGTPGLWQWEKVEEE